MYEVTDRLAFLVHAGFELDDGGDLTLLVHKGVEFEKKGAVPNPSTAGNDELRVILTVLTESLKRDNQRFRTLATASISANIRVPEWPFPPMTIGPAMLDAPPSI